MKVPIVRTYAQEESSMQKTCPFGRRASRLKCHIK